MAKADSTPVRLRDHIVEDLRSLLAEAQNGMSVPTFIELLLRESVAQMKSEQAPLERLPTIDTIRRQLGKSTPGLTAPESLEDRLQRMEAALQKLSTEPEHERVRYESGGARKRA